MHENKARVNVHYLCLSYKSKNNKSENKLLKCPPLYVHTAVLYNHPTLHKWYVIQLL